MFGVCSPSPTLIATMRLLATAASAALLPVGIMASRNGNPMVTPDARKKWRRFIRWERSGLAEYGRLDNFVDKSAEFIVFFFGGVDKIIQSCAI